jgi:hypothetical protein
MRAMVLIGGSKCVDLEREECTKGTRCLLLVMSYAAGLRFTLLIPRVCLVKVIGKLCRASRDTR